MEHTLITVVIPLYNTNEYLPQCLDSVLAQNYPSWECVIVDDGSTDGSVQTAGAYAARDPRFRLIPQEHAGVSYAIARGVEQAAGQWLYFLDSDDWIDPDELEQLLRVVTDHRCDMVASDFIIEEGTSSRRSIVRFQGVVEREAFPAQFYPHLLCNNRYSGLVCGNTRSGKLVRRELALKNLTLQMGLVFAEDAMLMLGILLDCGRVYGELSRAGYHYRMHNSSSMHNYGLAYVSHRAAYCRRLRTLFEEKNIAGDPVLEANYQRLQLYCVTGSIHYFRKDPGALEREYPEAYAWLQDTTQSLKGRNRKQLGLRNSVILWLLQHKLYSLLTLLYEVNHFLRYTLKR